MWWNIAICFVWLFLILTILLTIISFRKKNVSFHKKNAVLTKSINIVFAGLIISGFCGIFPTNYFTNEFSENAVEKFIEAFSLSLVNVMQMFSLDLGGKDLLDIISKQESFCLQQPYILTMSVLCTIAPLLTVGAIASALMSLRARNRYLFNFFKPAYIFSELNERSITLATDLKKNNPHTVIVFTDVVEREDETFYELSSRAKALGAILFKDDILSPSFQWHKKKSEIIFFIIGGNEAENITHSLEIIKKYKERDNTKLYLFSSTKESELSLLNVMKDTERKVEVHRVNETRTLIYRTLYEKGDVLFDRAIEGGLFSKKYINVVVLGMGNYGTEIVKALSWFCQMDDYKLTIHAFDKDEKVESKFKALCPDLLSTDYDGSDDGDADYSIIFHAGIDITTFEFVDCLKTLKDEKQVTFVFISLGSDEENVNAAVNVRMICKRLGMEPFIQTVVKNTTISKSLADASSYRGEKYNIDYIGDIQDEYSERVVINSELENKALKRHLKWDKNKSSFWANEYNYNSSTAPIIHFKARNNCGINGSYKLKSNPDMTVLNVEERRKLRCLEHRRWNAYMRAEGYVFGNQRDDIAKTHPNLKSFFDLPLTEQEKDEIV